MTCSMLRPVASCERCVAAELTCARSTYSTCSHKPRTISRSKYQHQIAKQNYLLKTMSPLPKFGGYQPPRSSRYMIQTVPDTTGTTTDHITNELDNSDAGNTTIVQYLNSDTSLVYTRGGRLHPPCKVSLATLPHHHPSGLWVPFSVSKFLYTKIE